LVGTERAPPFGTLDLTSAKKRPAFAAGLYWQRLRRLLSRRGSRRVSNALLREAGLGRAGQLLLDSLSLAGGIGGERGVAGEQSYGSGDDEFLQVDLPGLVGASEVKCGFQQIAARA
jgi:hypothetical protein